MIEATLQEIEDGQATWGQVSLECLSGHLGDCDVGCQTRAINIVEAILLRATEHAEQVRDLTPPGYGRLVGRLRCWISLAGFDCIRDDALAALSEMALALREL